MGFYWVVLGFTGFYWVLLGFTGFAIKRKKSRSILRPFLAIANASVRAPIDSLNVLPRVSFSFFFWLAHRFLGL